MLLRCIAVDDGTAQPNDVPGQDAREGLLISMLPVFKLDGLGMLVISSLSSEHVLKP